MTRFGEVVADVMELGRGSTEGIVSVAFIVASSERAKGSSLFGPADQLDFDPSKSAEFGPDFDRDAPRLAFRAPVTPSSPGDER